MKIAAILILTVLFALLPLTLAGVRWRTRLLVYAYFVTFGVAPFHVNLTFTLFFEDYWYIKGITRGLDVNVADFLLLSLVIDRFLDPRNRIQWAPPGTWAYGVLLLGMGLSITDALDRNLVVFELIKLLKGVAAFWVVANLTRTREGFAIVIDGIVLLTALLIAHVFGYFLVGDWLHQRLGHAPHKNVWALFLNTFAPVSMGLCFFRFRKLSNRVLFLTFVIGLGVMQKLSESRGGQALFLFGLLLTAGISLAALRRKGFNAAQAVLLVICISGGMAFFWDDISDRWSQGLVEHDPSLGGSKEVLSERREMRAMSWDVFDEHAINGVGFSNYTLYWFQKGTSQTMTHHLYLLTAAETGYVGLLALVIFLAYWVCVSFRLPFGRHPPHVTAVAAGLPAVFLILILHCLIEYNFRNTICLIAYCLMTGLATGIRKLR